MNLSYKLNILGNDLKENNIFSKKYKLLSTILFYGILPFTLILSFINAYLGFSYIIIIFINSIYSISKIYFYYKK